MRAYVPMSIGQLSNFCENAGATVSTVCLPTPSLAGEYGVSELEDLEYGALEVCRSLAEVADDPVIVALELEAQTIEAGAEKNPGVFMGDFNIAFADVVAFYVITDDDEELEWYDASESALCLAKVAG